MNRRARLALAAAPLIAGGSIAATTVTALPAHAAATPRTAGPLFTCPSFTACFYQNSDYTGDVLEETGPVGGPWTLITAGFRGSMSNRFTQKSLWVGNHQNGSDFCIAAGSRSSNQVSGGYYYILNDGGGCTQFPPPPL